MRTVYRARRIFFLVFLVLTICQGGAVPAGAQPPGSPPKEKLPPSTLDYPDAGRGAYPGLIPLWSYTSEKAKALAQRYRKELIQIINQLSAEYPATQMDVHAVGFLKSPGNIKKDARYLAAIVEVGKEYEKETIPFNGRVDDILALYVAPMATLLLNSKVILKDPQVAGIAVCPNWMVRGSQGVPRERGMSEGIFVTIKKGPGKALMQGGLSPSHLRAQADIYGRQGDRVFSLSEPEKPAQK